MCVTIKGDRLTTNGGKAANHIVTVHSIFSKNQEKREAQFTKEEGGLTLDLCSAAETILISCSSEALSSPGEAEMTKVFGTDHRADIYWMPPSPSSAQGKSLLG